MSYQVSRYGWLPDQPDHRDHFYVALVERPGALPAKVDLRMQCPPVYDQDSPAFTRPTRLPPQISPVISGQSASFND
jgi:hypothetical protein